MTVAPKTGAIEGNNAAGRWFEDDDPVGAEGAQPGAVVVEGIQIQGKGSCRDGLKLAVEYAVSEDVSPFSQ